MAHSDFAELSVDELQSYYSDFHKAFYGWRPRDIYTATEWHNRDFLIARINGIHDIMDAMKATPAGRAELRAAGWVFEEPEVIDPAEYAEWSADLDAEFYAEAQ